MWTCSTELKARGAWLTTAAQCRRLVSKASIGPFLKTSVGVRRLCARRSRSKPRISKVCPLRVHEGGEQHRNALIGPMPKAIGGIESDETADTCVALKTRDIQS